MRFKSMKILRRKPRSIDSDCDFAIIDRGDGHHCRYVVGTINQQSLEHGEWFWGHYFASLEAAHNYFNTR